MTPEHLHAAGLDELGGAIGADAAERFDHVLAYVPPLHERDVPPEHWYLLVIGVDPARHGSGIGTALIQPILQRADADGLPCYLETAQARNVSFYQHLGFRVMAEAENIARGRDLASDQARVTRYEIVDAIAIQESEDEGIGFYLELTGGRVLYLGGQHLYELADTRRFSSTAFEISRVAASGGFLALTPLGEYLAPSTEREPFTGEEYEHNRIPEDGAFVEAKFEDLRRSRTSS